LKNLCNSHVRRQSIQLNTIFAVKKVVPATTPERATHLRWFNDQAKVKGQENLWISGGTKSVADA